MSVSEAASVLRNVVRPRFLRAIPDKIASRVSHVRHRREAQATRAWCSEVATTPAEYMALTDEALARESTAFRAALLSRSLPILKRAGLPFGGGDPALLYFLVRHLRPRYVVETGVAAGFSSAAILSALDRNGQGELWSSELPYVRQPRPEDLVGLVVPEDLRRRWHLFLDGDQRNLRRIRDEVPQVDLLHYDSDKSYRGRARLLTELAPKMTGATTIVMDDIEDNAYFHKLVAKRPRFHVVHSDGRFVGVVPCEGTPSR